MGLDNGIECRRRDGKNVEGDEDTKEVMYLRKFWPVRNDIVAWLNGIYNTGEEDFLWYLDDADLIKIEGILREWLGRVGKGERASTVWGDDEEGEILENQVERMVEFREWLKGKNREDYVVAFYDSY